MKVTVTEWVRVEVELSVELKVELGEAVVDGESV